MSEERQLSEAERTAKLAVDFLVSEFGKTFIKQLGMKYNDLHQDAESDSLTAEQKGMKIERAAGVKWAIDFLLERQRLVESGYFNKEDVAKS